MDEEKGEIMIYGKESAYDPWRVVAYGDEERWDGESFYLAEDTVTDGEFFGYPCKTPYYHAKLVRFGVEYYYRKKDIFS